MPKETTTSKLSPQEFEQIIKNAPLVSIDLIVRNAKDQILLGLRKNQPAKGFWFVPGGRIYKDEKIETAFGRIVKKELGLIMELKDAEFCGLFEHFYGENKYEKPGFGTHYVVLAFEIKEPKSLCLSENDQHSKYKWLKFHELLNAKDVHKWVKKFFGGSFIVPNDSGLYHALMSHYIHYDQQFWSRTQILLAIQGAALVGGYGLRSSWLGLLIMFGTIPLIIVIALLIKRDIENSEVNETQMDLLAKKLMPSIQSERSLSLRSDAPPWRRGKKLICWVICTLIALNIFLGSIYWWNPNYFVRENPPKEVSPIHEKSSKVGGT